MDGGVSLPMNPPGLRGGRVSPDEPFEWARVTDTEFVSSRKLGSSRWRRPWWPRSWRCVPGVEIVRDPWGLRARSRTTSRATQGSSRASSLDAPAGFPHVTRDQGQFAPRSPHVAGEGGIVARESNEIARGTDVFARDHPRYVRDSSLFARDSSASTLATGALSLRDQGCELHGRPAARER